MTRPTQTWGALLVAFKRLLCRFVPLTEFCKSCGRRVDLVWYVSDELWARVVGDPGTIRCPMCFNREASALGVGVLYWTAKERP